MLTSLQKKPRPKTSFILMGISPPEHSSSPPAWQHHHDRVSKGRPTSTRRTHMFLKAALRAGPAIPQMMSRSWRVKTQHVEGSWGPWTSAYKTNCDVYFATTGLAVSIGRA